MDMCYIRSLGYFISRDFIKSLNGVGHCLEDAPDFWQDKLLGVFIFYAASEVVPAILKARSLRKT
ncbi:hypothetical protein MKX03_002128 [Papaver bracteatum]|nr:hypothetical protein MKX03_002128 [Papaver bracteatum]